MRSNPKTKAIPIILLSARAGEESRVEGMEHGADGYIKLFSAREQPFDQLIWDNMVKEHFWLPPDADVTIFGTRQHQPAR